MLATSKTCHEASSAVEAALHTAFCLGEERVNTAIPPLMPPSSHPTLTNSIVLVALQRTLSILKTLVPKSSQTDHCSSCLCNTIGTKLETRPIAAQNTVESVERQAVQPVEKEKRYRELRRRAAAIETNTSHNKSKKSSPAEWELQAATLSQSLLLFTTSLNNCSVAGDLTRDLASPLSASALVLWDIILRGTTACLKFLGLSLNLFAAYELLSMNEGAETDIAILRLQSMLIVVVDGVMELPSLASEHKELIRRFAVQASSLVVAKMHVVMSSMPEGDNNDRLLNLNWNRWVGPQAMFATEGQISVHAAQFCLNVWNTAMSVAR
ncbi:unnamed protein product [Peronospora belbahrii]|uniref:Uncharacterized protein n=1 Tax=Peronospora belbahrii TaxID=622444 RepID=A0ABN8CPG7_9STRA|nr:unnamed protein product [Peronospora belbahrii]